MTTQIQSNQNQNKEYYEGYIKSINLGCFVCVTGYTDQFNNSQDRLIFLKDVYVAEEDRWLYREFLRKNFLRKKIRWNFEGEVILNNSNKDNLTHLVLAEGYAKVKGKAEELKKISAEAQKKQIGIFKASLEKTAVPTPSSLEFNKFVYERFRDKPALAIVEEVINASLYKLTLINDNRFVYLVLDGIQAWGTDSQYDFINRDDQYKLPFKYIESKRLAEFTVLNREVGVQVSGLDIHGNLIGFIYHSRQDMYKLYNELLVMGAAKITTFITALPVDVRVEFEARQDEAQSEKSMIWKALEASSDESFNGTVVEVYSGDCLGVYDEDKKIVTRLNLAGVKAPNMGGNQEQEPWAIESKEFLINACIGKKVSCKVEFKRTTQNGFKLAFSTIVIKGETDNLSFKVIEAGFGQFVNPRDNEPELSYGIKLKNCYKDADAREVGMHKDPFHQSPKILDLTNDKSKFSKYCSVLVPNRTKPGQAMVMPVLEAFVEAVIAPNKFRVRLVKENYLINVFLAGVNAISNDQNSAEFQVYSQSLIFSKFNVNQRKVSLELENYDKYGNFFGYVTVTQVGETFNETILKSGNAHWSPNSGRHRILEKCYEHAKNNEIGLFQLKLYKITELLTPKKSAVYYFSDIYEPNLIYLREHSTYCADLESSIKDLIRGTCATLETMTKPYKKLNYCLVYDEETKEHYRAKIMGLTAEHVDCLLIDYGTYLSTNHDNAFILPSKLYKIPQLAIPVSLYGLKMPALHNKGATKCIDYLHETFSSHEEFFFDSDYKKVSNFDSYNCVIYTSQKDRDVNKTTESLNFKICKEGYAICLNSQENKNLIDSLKGVMSMAIRDNVGLWGSGELSILDDE